MWLCVCTKICCCCLSLFARRLAWCRNFGGANTRFARGHSTAFASQLYALGWLINHTRRTHHVCIPTNCWDRALPIHKSHRHRFRYRHSDPDSCGVHFDFLQCASREYSRKYSPIINIRLYHSHSNDLYAKIVRCQPRPCVAQSVHKKYSLLRIDSLLLCAAHIVHIKHTTHIHTQIMRIMNGL